MGLKTFPGGIHPPDAKAYSRKSVLEKMPLPSRVIIPLSQHIGAPAKALVQVGDNVLTGQKIAEPGGFVSIPMHASISGKVTKIAKFPHPSGIMSEAIEITGDGLDRWVELKENPVFFELSSDDMKKIIAHAGICGMGGAGFPTHVKLSPPAGKNIDTVLLNGVECEPYLTADYRLMLEKPEEIITGLKIILKILGAKRGIIGVEANKPDVIKLFQQLLAAEESISVTGLRLKYPQGAEKQLIYAVTRRKVPNRGGLPMDVGVVVHNVGTAYAIYEALRFGKPLIERIITVTGKIVRNPKNLLARVGTLFSELVAYCGGTSEEIGKIVAGGPMMGFAVPTLDTPLAKGSSGLLILSHRESQKDKEHTCLRCGRCVDICPMNLVPSLIANSVRYNDWAQAERYGVLDCMKCGSCSYVCPSQIKLIQWIDIGKLKIAEIKAKS
ncbi:MAG: electron transport complex subunit RsxC [Candidatus Cloacimonetes bacterium]|nr:electron transport complex subunit RsxC [Candidatus Cloacimonadota bacterium]